MDFFKKRRSLTIWVITKLPNCQKTKKDERMFGMRMTPVVQNLLIINVLMFFGTSDGALAWLQNELVLYSPFPNENGVSHFKIWQPLTHMFMHGGFTHLFSNMFGLFMFGTILEDKWGSIRFLFFYLMCGFGALLLHVIIIHFFIDPYAAYKLLGASGAVYGVLIAFMLYFPNVELMLLFPPIPMKAKYLIGGFLVLDIFFGVMGSPTGIAHFAHIGGALSGFLLVTYWKRTGEAF